jgi:hypothetical protein
MRRRISAFIERSKNGDLAAAGGLGVVHRQVGVAQQLLGARAVARVERDSHARRHEHVGADRERGRERLDHVARRLGGVDRVAHLGQHHRELVAAQPRHDVRLAHAAAQARRRLHQQLVAGGMADAVVHVREAVEIDEQHRERAAAALGRRHRARQLLQAERPVGKLGERIEVRAALQLVIPLGGGERHRDAIREVAQQPDLFGRRLPRLVIREHDRAGEPRVQHDGQREHPRRRDAVQALRRRRARRAGA